MIGNNVLVAQHERENTSTGGIILTGDTTKGSKPGFVLSIGGDVTTVAVKDTVYLDWSKTMPVDVDGQAAAIIDVSHIKAVVG